MTVSSLTHEGIPEVWKMTEGYFSTTRGNGALDQRRRDQSVDWMHTLIMESLRTRFYASPSVQSRLEAVENAVAHGRMPALAAALDLIAASGREEI